MFRSLIRRFCKYSIRNYNQRLRSNINNSRYQRSWKEYNNISPVVLALPVPAIIRIYDNQGQNIGTVDIFSSRFLTAVFLFGIGIYIYRESWQDQLQSSLKQKEMENEELSTQFNDTIESLKNQQTQLNRKLSTEKTEMHIHLDKYKSQNRKLSTEKTEMQKRLDKYKTQLSHVDHVIKSFEDDMKAVNVRNQILLAEKGELNTRIDNTNKENDKLTEKLVHEKQQSEALSVKLESTINESDEYKTKLVKICEQKRYTFNAITNGTKIENNGRTIKVLSKQYGKALSSETYDSGVHVFEIRWTGTSLCGAHCQIGICTDDDSRKLYCDYEWHGWESYVKYENGHDPIDTITEAEYWESGDVIYMILDLNKKELSYWIRHKPCKIINIPPGSYHVYFTCDKSTDEVKFEIL